MRSFRGGAMRIAGGGVVGNALAGTDRKDWFPLVEGTGVSGLESRARSLPFEGFDGGGVPSLLVAIAIGGSEVETILLICWEFKRGLGLSDI